MAIRSVKEMMALAREEIDNVSPAEAKRRVEEEGAVIVDIRDVRELQKSGVIPNAMHAPRGMLEFWVDPESPYAKPEFAEDREFIFH
jgi:rhodanese-related sulfurtransferase